jgi:hypothetical protein
MNVNNLSMNKYGFKYECKYGFKYECKYGFKYECK